jgi:hypothetical protein
MEELFWYICIGSPKKTTRRYMVSTSPIFYVYYDASGGLPARALDLDPGEEEGTKGDHRACESG